MPHHHLPFSALLMIVVAFVAVFTGPRTPLTAGSEPVAAWVQLGHGGDAIARVVTRAPACPAVSLDGRSLVMEVRAQPSIDFPALVCERELPAGGVLANVGGIPLPLPKSRPERIVIVGDTGCRVSNFEGKEDIQDCNDSTAWPAARVAVSAAARHPDLVIHVGDYVYRESPCPSDHPGCSGSPYGDNLATWIADFFQPEAKLLAAAPMVFMRGNHEACDREGNGWFRFLEAGPMPATCLDYTDPYAIQAGDLQLLMLDTSKAADDFHYDPVVAADYELRLAVIRDLAGPNAFLLTHAPIWVFGHAGEEDGTEQLYRDDENLQAASHNELPASVGAVISGHLHLFEALGFDGGRAAQLIVGNGGTELDPPISTLLTGLDIAGATVAEGRSFDGYGYVTLERVPAGWSFTLLNENGISMLGCELVSRMLTCHNPVSGSN